MKSVMHTKFDIYIFITKEIGFSISAKIRDFNISLVCEIQHIVPSIRNISAREKKTEFPTH